jgi:cyclohexanone monooxygenase
VGTGSTGIQAIPAIAKQAEHVYVFQRTPNFSVPAQNAPLDPEFVRELKANYREHRRKQRESFFGVPVEPNPKSALEVTPAEQRQEYETRWAYGGGATVLQAFADLLINKQANDTVADFVRSKIRETVRDPAVAEKLMPHDHPLGTKRICVDTGYYDTYNRENVTLIDIRDAPIEEITPTGLTTGTGDYALDAIVFAIGFDAMTGALFDIDIRGRGGVTLRSKWSDGPRMYLGLAAAGFPNLFAITGPGSPSVLSNMVVSIEQHVEWISDCMEYMREHGYREIEATADAEDGWMAHVEEVGNFTLFPQAKSWYTGANVPGKKRVFMPYVGGVGLYAQKCSEVAANGYEGFSFAKVEAHAGG